MRRSGSFPGLLGLNAAVVLAYVAAATVGFRLAFVAEQVTTVWAPTGIALAALLVGGSRVWPGVWLGALLANVGTSAPAWTAFVIASGNTLEAVAAVWLLRRMPWFEFGFQRVTGVLAFILIAAISCTAISATVGVVTLCAAGVQAWGRFPALWFDWWLGDALGALVVAPAIMTTLHHAWSRRDWIRTSIWVAGSIAFTHALFGQQLGASAHPLEYAIFPIVIAAALTGGPSLTSLVVLGVSVVTIWHTVHGSGPFATLEVHRSLILLQAFTGILAGTSLLLAAAIAERRLTEHRERDAANELRQAETALLESRDVLSLAMRGGAMGAWSRNLATNAVWWSRELEGIFGLEPGAFTRSEDGFFAFVHEDDRQTVRTAVSEALRNGSDYIVDFRFRHANGEWRWMEGRGRAVYDSDKQARTLYGIGIDVTTRKRAEIALQQAKAAAEGGQRRLAEANRELARRVLEQQTLLDVLPIGIGIATDPNCQHIRTNRAFAQTLGLSPDTNASKTAPDQERPTNFRVLTPDGAEVPDDALPMQVAAREGREVRDAEFDIVHDDGRIVRLLEYAAPLLDEHGTPRGAVGAFVDVTRRKKAEAALRQEVEVRTTLAQVGASLAGELKSDALIQAVTDASTNLTEAEVGAFHTVPDDYGYAIVRVDDVTKDPRYDRQVPYGLPEGRQGVRSYLAVPVIGRNGVVFGGLFFGHSQPGVFTERHELLASGVAGWAAIALDNARLYRDAEEANRLKDEFLATLSHELRTPLNAVLGWAHMLREGTMQPSMRQRALESLERNARTQAQLVEDLLDVSRIMAGKLQLKADEVDLRTVITNAVETVRAGVTAKRLDLHLHVPEDRRLLVTGDADRLQQVVWNLVANAVKFTPNGGRVDVELRQVDGKATIEVRDTGQGIDPSFRAHLFERFRQMDASKTRAHGGLGLGLSIVRHLVEAHGGTVEAESEGVGRGATFSVVLPLRAAVDGRPNDAAVATGAADRTLADVRALVVDDEDDARELTRYVLESRGGTVVATRSAGEALHLLSRDRFDVVIADIGMPEQDGLSLIRAIRGLPADSPNRDVPAMAVTAYASVRDRDEALAAGFDGHFGKPFDPEELIGAIVAKTAPRDARS